MSSRPLLIPVLITLACSGPKPPPAAPEPLPPPPVEQPPAPIEEEPPPPTQEPAEVSVAQPDDAIPLEGTLASRKGKSLVVTIDHPDPPAKGTGVTLYKYFEKQIGPFGATGWLGIAEATVTRSSDLELHLRIDKELSVMTVNGKKVNHFKKGSLVRLESDP